MITPEALAAHATKLGWTKGVTYGQLSDVWNNPAVPYKLIIPRTDKISDYRRVVRDLVRDFTRGTGLTESQVKRELGWRDPRVDVLQDQVHEHCGVGLKDEAALAVLDAIDAAGERS